MVRTLVVCAAAGQAHIQPGRLVRRHRRRADVPRVQLCARQTRQNGREAAAAAEADTTTSCQHAARSVTAAAGRLPSRCRASFSMHTF